MIKTSSITTRFIVSIFANILRTGITFLAGLLLARGLGPSQYGNMMFLLGSFLAIRSLMNVGSSNAFFTFISQKPQTRNYFLVYFAWLGLQAIIIVLFTTLILPQSIVDKVWLGQSRFLVILAFGASFIQQQLWQSVVQVGEAYRKTVKIQIIGTVIAIIHLIFVTIMLTINYLSVESVLWLMLIEYLVASIITFWLLGISRVLIGKGHEGLSTLNNTFGKYWSYCKPLVLLALVAFLYEFADRWMLQRFGGSMQQGFYQISYQFSTISLLATTSILNIFWKEVAEANEKGNNAKVANIYSKVNQSLFMLGAFTSGLLVPWSKEIVLFLLGPAYYEAWPILALMFLYPIHQSMGQIGGAMYLASGHTRQYTKLSITVMLLSLPLSYFALAPNTGLLIPGLGLGAMGVAIKSVFINIFSVNIQAFLLARIHGWKFKWAYQLYGIGLALGIGYVTKMFVGMIWDLSVIGTDLFLPMLFASCIYIITIICIFWFMPSLLGLNRVEIINIVRRGNKI